MTSSVSVMSSPNLASLPEPQQGQLSGATTTTRSRGRCSGNGFLEGRLRSNAWTVDVRAAFAEASSSSVALASSSSSCSSIWSNSRALRSERLPWISRFSFSISSWRRAISALACVRSACSRTARASASIRAARSARYSARIVSRSSGSWSAASIMHEGNHIRRRSASGFFYPAAVGCHVFCGMRQSIPSRR